MSRFIFRSRSRADVEAFFSAAWTQSQILLPRGNRVCSVYLSGATMGALGYVYARYGSDLTWIPQPARNDFVVTSCLAGRAKLREGDATSEWWPGVYRAASAESEMMISGSAKLEMATVTVPRKIVETRLRHWLGVDPQEPLQLHQIVSANTASAWEHLAQYAKSLALWAPSEVAVTMLADYAADILINLHQHNYSTSLARLPSANEVAIAKAWEFISANADRPAQPLDVALFAGVSLKSLARAFRERYSISVAEALRRHRLALLDHIPTKASADELSEIAGRLGFPSVEAMLHWKARGTLKR